MPLTLSPEKKQEIIGNKMISLTWTDQQANKAINGYIGNMRLYEKNKELFSKKGFSFCICEKILTVAMLTVWDAYYLFRFAKQLLDGGTYLEIGSAGGGSLLCAFLATEKSRVCVNFIVIDPFVWKTEMRFYKNTSSIPRLRLINSKSDEAKKEIKDSSIDLLFIDGDHSYEQAKKDIINYWPKVKIGGTLLGHNYRQGVYPGVKKAVDEIFSKEAVVLLPDSSIFKVIKKNEAQYRL